MSRISGNGGCTANVIADANLGRPSVLHPPRSDNLGKQHFTLGRGDFTIGSRKSCFGYAVL